MASLLKNVGLLDLAFGVAQTLPELDRLYRGLFQLATLAPNRKFSIGKVIEYWAEKTPQQVAIRFEDKHWTYAEFNRWANRLADSFKARGIRSGDAVGILMENRPEVLVCVAAAVKLGAVAAMLNPNQRGQVLEHSLKLVNPKLIVISSECQDAINSTAFSPARHPHIQFMWNRANSTMPCPQDYVDIEKDAPLRSDRNPRSTQKVLAKQPCYYIFTSGTTGMPKASIMTHYRWGAVMCGIGGASLRVKSDDVLYCCLPLYHNNALTVSWGAVLSAGATLALDRKFSASRFWERIRYYDATSFCYIGELLRYLLNQPASPLDKNHRIRIIVGNGLRAEIWDQFEKRFGIHRICEFYGASESNIGFINVFGVSQTAGFTPLPFAIVEFDPETEEPVRDRNGFMRRVPRGGTGLLISEVSPRRPFDGYTDPSASQKKLFRDVFKRGDCWFNSGDLVRDQGLRHIQFVDRVGDTFRWKGENVATSEVEAVLASHPEVDHAVVYGVEVPGADGRAGMAAITLRDGCAFHGKAVAQFLSSKLPHYAIPLFVRLKQEQDTTGTFKYRKVDLKKEGFNLTQVTDPLFVL
ncbi:MAG TPA: long-chain-acyl-CoA synthetase, partial [Pseudomonadales bacterium]|nr:long-chain-acyl-CoA synthetase [Pseudomonadales bacterium]